MLALSVLRPDDATTRQVLSMLGMAPHPAEPTGEEIPSPPSITDLVRPDVPIEAVPETRPTAVEEAPPRTANGTDTARLPPTIVQVVDRLRSGEPPRPIPPLSLPQPPPPARESASLLPPGQQRAIVSRLSGRREPVGDVDVDRLVGLIAERAQVRELPRQSIVSTRRGLQLLLDFGPGMRGFARDRREIQVAVTSAVGTDGVQVQRFAGTPLDHPGAGPGNRSTWARYQPPVEGRPVLVVSDLGAGPSPRSKRQVVEKWLETAQLLRRAGCPVRALVPAPVDRVHPDLLAVLGVLSWDRTTGVRDAVAATGR